VAVLCFALAGALLGFLRWNFHPATIFVGTSGTMFIGYTLALLAILGTAKVAVAMLVLSVPIIDTFWNIVRRLAAGKSPFTPDRGHLHHRLLDVGLSHTQTVLLIYCLCIALAVLTFVLSGAAQIYAFVIYVVGSGLALYLLSRWTMRDGGPPASDPVDGPRTPDWSPRGSSGDAVPSTTPTAPRERSAPPRRPGATANPNPAAAANPVPAATRTAPAAVATGPQIERTSASSARPAAAAARPPAPSGPAATTGHAPAAREAPRHDR